MNKYVLPILLIGTLLPFSVLLAYLIGVTSESIIDESFGNFQVIIIGYSVILISIITGYVAKKLDSRGEEENMEETEE